MALLEADVNFKVARSFVDRIRERAVQEDVLKSLTPGQQVVKITNDELTQILGASSSKLESGSGSNSILLMVGLNGSGKTTTTAKIAKYLTKFWVNRLMWKFIEEPTEKMLNMSLLMGLKMALARILTGRLLILQVGFKLMMI